MKWFKHYTNAHKGKVLQRLYLEFGKPAGYGLYFLFTSYVADMWDGNGDPEFVIYAPELCSHLGIKRFKLNSFLECFQNIPRTFPEHSENKLNFRFELDKNILKINFPKLSKIRHRDALNASTRQALSQHESGLEEKREEENKKKTPVVGEAISDAKRQEARLRFASQISHLEKILDSLYGNLAPKGVKRLVPDMIVVCEGNAVAVEEILNDIFQSPKIQTGEGLTGSKSAYITVAIKNRFGFDEAAA